MKKKLIIIFVSLIIIFFIIFKLTKAPIISKKTYLKDNKEYKNIDKNNIYSIEINKYTEGGINSKLITNQEEINNLYQTLMNIKYGEETEMACDDNTTIYVINFNDGTNKKVEIECDWIIIDNKRYLIEK